MKLWLIRHAPVLLPAGICYGASDVLADDEASLHAAQRAAEQLPQGHCLGLVLRVSGLQRAQQLANHLALLRPDLPAAVVDTRLNELNFGCWEMQPWDSIAKTEFDNWLADFDNHCFGGVESTQMILQRVGQALQGMQSDELWITHAGVVRAVQWIVEHGSAPVQKASNWPATVVEPGGLFTVEIPVLPSA